ncbi:hypothetical protein M9H77_02931 [Catharanthus roseus]|uniref:Uncharacterized protein n=1 Tax=Catharanthus roseus TaxID=4058 RepID=A0ACC0CAA0_CATRO|nr:hypothetical protein M9H77_02931 [Catharanthus roseus]
MVELIDKPILAKKKITQEIMEQYKEFYANLIEEFGHSESLACGQVYVRGHVIDFSPANIAYYLNCPYYSDIEGTCLEEEVDFDEVAKGTRPPGDAKVCSSWCGSTVSYSIHTRTYWSRWVYKAVVQDQSGSLSPPSPSADSLAVTTSLDFLNQQLSNLLGIEVVLLFNGVEDLKGFKVKQLVPRGALKS